MKKTTIRDYDFGEIDHKFYKRDSKRVQRRSLIVLVDPLGPSFCPIKNPVQ